MKILPVGTEIFPFRRTDKEKLIVAFRNFCEKRPKLSEHKFRRTYILFKRCVSYRAVSYRHKRDRRVLVYVKKRKLSLCFL